MFGLGRSNAASAAKKQPRRSLRARLTFEELEDRSLPSGPSAREQFMIELVNRMRMDPAGELQRILDENDPDVNNALAFFNVNRQTLASQFAALTPVAPLAWHQALEQAAAAHSQLMLQFDQQSHQLPGEPDLGTRVTNAGYPSFQALGENVFAFAESVFHAHAAFAIDWGNGTGGIQSPPGHRQNILSPNFREIGIGIVDATAGKDTGPLLVTQDFGNRFGFGSPFLVGVVFNDADADGFYSVGEGLANVNVQISNGGSTFSTQTMTAGGYQIQLAAGSYTVTFSGGGLASPVVKSVIIGSANVKSDVGVGVPAPTVGFALTSSSGGEGTTPAQLTVTLSRAVTQSVSVNFAVTGGTATGGGIDFTRANGALTFSPGQTTRIIPITIVNDARDEIDETVRVTLSSPTNADLGANTVHTFTILDNDPAPKVGFALVSSSAGEAIGNVNLAVKLSAASGKTVTVDYAVSGGTAAGGGADFTLSSGTLTFTPGQTTLNIPITIHEDALDENGETVQVTLSNPSAATLNAITKHTFSIIDNDAMPTVGFDLTASSGSEGNSPANVALSLSAVSGRSVTVSFQTSNGAALAASDYTANSSTLTFLPGETAKAIPITILEDALDEFDETLRVTLSGNVNAFLGTAAHTFTIQDNDAPPIVQFLLAASNGDESLPSPLLTVDLSGPSAKRIIVSYAVSGGTAAAGLDFTLLPGRLVFLPGQTSKNVPLAILHDRIDEHNETVSAALSSPIEATLGVNVAHTYTILDNDDPPAVGFRFTTSSASEGLGAGNLVVQLSRVSGKIVTVDAAVTGGTATNGADYDLPPGTIIFDPGQVVKVFAVPLTDDTTDELNQTVEVTLTNPMSATLGAIPVHVFTIVDNDLPPKVSFSVNAALGNEAAGVIGLLVSLTAESEKPITVPFAVTGGTAKQNIDFLFSSGTLNFAAGQTSKSLTFEIVDDALVELAETLRIGLLTPTNAVLGVNPSFLYTIADNDA